MSNQVNPDTGNISVTYKPDGNIATITDPKSLTTTYSYNGFGELISINSPDTGITTITRNKSGNPVSPGQPGAGAREQGHLGKIARSCEEMRDLAQTFLQTALREAVQAPAELAGRERDPCRHLGLDEPRRDGVGGIPACAAPCRRRTRQPVR